MIVIQSKQTGAQQKSTGAVVDLLVGLQDFRYFQVLMDYLKGPAGTFEIDMYDGGDVKPDHLPLLRENLIAAQRHFSDKPATWEEVIDTFSFDPHTKERQPIQIRHLIDNGVLLRIIQSLISLSESAEKDSEYLIFIED